MHLNLIDITESFPQLFKGDRDIRKILFKLVSDFAQGCRRIKLAYYFHKLFVPELPVLRSRFPYSFHTHGSVFVFL